MRIVGAEPRDQLGERRLAGLDDLAREEIGIDDRGAARGEQAWRPCSCPTRSRRSARSRAPRGGSTTTRAAMVACAPCAPARPPRARTVRVATPLRATARLDRQRGVRRVSSQGARGVAGRRRTRGRATRFARRPETRCLALSRHRRGAGGPAIAVEVGCEACHGAGAAYAEDDVMRDRPVALALGLVDVSTPKDARRGACHAVPRARDRPTPFIRSAPARRRRPPEYEGPDARTSSLRGEAVGVSAARRCPRSRSSGARNVGKSSLINALVGHDDLARTSRTPGRTRLLNWFEIERQGDVPPRRSAGLRLRRGRARRCARAGAR